MVDSRDRGAVSPRIALRSLETKLLQYALQQECYEVTKIISFQKSTAPPDAG